MQNIETPVRLTRRTLVASGAAATALGVLPVRAQVKHGKVTVLTGSPRRRGTSFLLADEFIRGVREQGAEVFRFDAAFKRVTACSGCDHCGLGSSPCVYRDDMFEVNPHLLSSNLIVFCTPLYYFGFSAQLKLVIDRFYAINSQFHNGGRKAVLLATAWNNDSWTMSALTNHYRTLVRYMGWEDIGSVLATGCGTRSDIEASEFPQQAYELGRNVKIL